MRYVNWLKKIVGLIYAKDLLVSWKAGELVILDDILRPIHFVEPSLPVSELLRVFKSGKHHLAIVKKKGDGEPILGLVTMQDALEAIVGDIREEI